MSVQESKYALGVDIGGTNIKLGIVDGNGKVIKKNTVPTLRLGGEESVITQLKLGIKEILLSNKYQLEGIGIGAAGTVSIKKGTVEYPPNIPGWKVVRLVKIIKDEFNLSVFIDNDANAAAIGELQFGAGKELKTFALITLGTGVGGGLIIDRKIYRGSYGVAGEIGHICIVANGRKCKCGSNGCVEAYVGNHYLIEIVKEELKNRKDSKINDLLGNKTELLTPELINNAYLTGDKYAKEIIIRVGEYVGVALSSVSNLLEIDSFIIGGGVSAFGSPLLKSIKKSLVDNVLKILKDRINVYSAKLRNDAGLIGASSLVFYNLDN